MFTLGFVLCLMTGSLLVYLSSENQRLLMRPLAISTGRGVGIAFIAAGVSCALANFSVVTAICGSVVLLMCLWGLLPLLSLLPLFSSRERKSTYVD